MFTKPLLQVGVRGGGCREAKVKAVLVLKWKRQSCLGGQPIMLGGKRQQSMGGTGADSWAPPLTSCVTLGPGSCFSTFRFHYL